MNPFRQMIHVLFRADNRLAADRESNSYHYGFWDSMKIAYQEHRARSRLWNEWE